MIQTVETGTDINGSERSVLSNSCKSRCAIHGNCMISIIKQVLKISWKLNDLVYQTVLESNVCNRLISFINHNLSIEYLLDTVLKTPTHGYYYYLENKTQLSKQIVNTHSYICPKSIPN